MPIEGETPDAPAQLGCCLSPDRHELEHSSPRPWTAEMIASSSLQQLQELSCQVCCIQHNRLGHVSTCKCLAWEGCGLIADHKTHVQQSFLVSAVLHRRSIAAALSTRLCSEGLGSALAGTASRKLCSVRLSHHQANDASHLAKEGAINRGGMGIDGS